MTQFYLSPADARAKACCMQPALHCVAESCMAWREYFQSRAGDPVPRGGSRFPPMPPIRDVPTGLGYCGMVRS